MKGLKQILTILIVLTIVRNAFAQTTSTPTEEYKYGIGGGAGFTTGYGLSFRYLPKKFGAQLNFAPYKSEDTETYSVGLTFVYKIIESKITNLYLYQGNHYYYNSYMSYVYNPEFPFNEEFKQVKESYINNGVGFGIEIILAKRIGLNLMAGYAFYDNFRKINVTGEAALYYKF